MSTGAHVLVVDDDEDILKLLTMRLRAKGFRITAVGSAEQALSSATSVCPVRTAWRCLKKSAGRGRRCPSSCSRHTATFRMPLMPHHAAFSAT